MISSKARLKRLVAGRLPVVMDTWRRFKYRRLLGRTPGDIFSEYYRKNEWRGDASVSGPGSNLTRTAEIRGVLPELISTYDVGVLLDLPCGDFAWMQHVDVNASYIGGDIVPELVERNRELYGRKGVRFEVIDILNDELPSADLLLCRDCLNHFSYADVYRTFRNVARSGIPYLLTTTFTECDQNEDVVTGGWRPLNLQKAPFHFPAPLRLINEKCDEFDGRYADKSLGLWRVADLRLDSIGQETQA